MTTSAAWIAGHDPRRPAGSRHVRQPGARRRTRHYRQRPAADSRRRHAAAICRRAAIQLRGCLGAELNQLLRQPLRRCHDARAHGPRDGRRLIPSSHDWRRMRPSKACRPSWTSSSRRSPSSTRTTTKHSGSRGSSVSGLGPDELARDKYAALVRNLLMVGGALCCWGARTSKLLDLTRRSAQPRARRAVGARRQPRPSDPQLVTESRLLAIAGAAAGVGIAIWLKELVQVLLLPASNSAGVDPRCRSTLASCSSRSAPPSRAVGRPGSRRL